MSALADRRAPSEFVIGIGALNERWYSSLLRAASANLVIPLSSNLGTPLTDNDFVGIPS